MKKTLFLISVFSFMTGAAFSQTNPRIEKAIQDPNRAQNEAKADVYIQKKTIVSDSTQGTENTPKVAQKKKRSCKRKPSNL